MASLPLLLIVGMHRSGTSLLGSLLPACGISMPGALIPGDIHNPEGYFERADVTTLQEQLLIDLERWWPSPRGMQALPQGWLKSPVGRQALADLTAVLQPEAERHQGPWAIKDPRSSLLLPLWIAACQRLKIPLKLLLAVRDPAEVMVSLVQRDQAATGMDGWRAQRLWWHHNAQVLREGRDLPLQVVSYSHWFNPSSADEQLRQLAPELSRSQRMEALTAVKPQHRRSRQAAAADSCHVSVKRLYQRLQQASLHPDGNASLRRWVERTPAPPTQPPPPATSPTLRIGQWLRNNLATTGDDRLLNHPWRYMAEIRVGSDPRTLRQTINHWHCNGFSDNDLRHAAALPFTAPHATHQQLLEWNKTAHGTVNNASIQAGPIGSAQLLMLANQDLVFDRSRTRVGLLRQFGVRAFWLPA